MNSDTILNTIKYKTYFLHLDLKSNRLICTAYKYDGDFKLPKSKNDILKSVKDLGREVFNKTRETLVIYDEIDETITQDNNFDDINIVFFKRLEQIILENYEVKKIISTWFKNNGIPNFFYNFSLPNLIDDYKINYNEINEIINKQIIEDKKFNNSIIYPINSSGMSNVVTNVVNYLEPFYKKLNKYDFDVIPLLNIAIFTYLTFSIRNVLGTGRTSQLKKYLQPFPYLYQKYKDMNFIYTTEFGRTITNYLKKALIYITQYVKRNIEVNNQKEIDFSDTIDLPQNEDEADWTDFYFLREIYMCNNPFLTAFEYLMQICTTTLPLSYKYQCKECGRELTKKQNLCYDCKINYLKITINEFRSKNKNTKILEEELNGLKKDKNSPTPKIEKLYYDKNYHRENDKKKKKINKKIGIYNNNY